MNGERSAGMLILLIRPWHLIACEIATATFGFSGPVPIEVVIAFAVS